MEDKKKTGCTRREFIKGTAIGAGAAAVAGSGLLSACATTGGAHRGNSPIFQPTRIGSLTLKNKMIRAAMADRRYDANGNPTSNLPGMYGDEAAGGVAMTITGGISVLRDDATNTVFPAFTEASQVSAYRVATDAVHKNGGKLCAQIMIVGTAGGPFDVTRISREDIRRCVDGFARTTVLARDAGYDAVEFHFAHGYLGAQMWSHYRNTRTDEYGGSAENRARFAFEALEAVRRALGRDFPLIAKINSDEYIVREGSSPEETNFYVQGLADRGIDAVEISGIGWNVRFAKDILSKEDQNFFARPARSIARSVNVPLILTGGIRNVEMAEEALKHNDKLVGFGMARTLLFEPDLPLKWQKDTNYTPQCISCQWCTEDPERTRVNYIATSDPVARMNFRATCVFNRNRA